MQIRNGIAIVQTPKKPKRRTAPDFKLKSVTMIHGKKGALRLPDFAPIVELMKRSGWK